MIDIQSFAGQNKVNEQRNSTLSDVPFVVGLPSGTADQSTMIPLKSN
jgi:hypothetical protein